MRNRSDRIRHAIAFEIIGLLLVVPLGGLVFGTAPQDLGVVALSVSVLATLWTYGYNVLFDRAMMRLRGSVAKTPALRIVHAVVFEAGLLMVTVPAIAAYLGITLWQAFVMDAALAAFYLVYAIGFNWAYDVIFPVPGVDQASSSASQ